MIKSLYIKENTDHAIDWEYICTFDISRLHSEQLWNELIEFYEKDFWMIKIVNEPPVMKNF